MRHHAEAVERSELPDYSSYDKDMQTKRRATENSELNAYQ